MPRIELRAAPAGCGRKVDLMMHIILKVGTRMDGVRSGTEDGT